MPATSIDTLRHHRAKSAFKRYDTTCTRVEIFPIHDVAKVTVTRGDGQNWWTVSVESRTVFSPTTTRGVHAPWASGAPRKIARPVGARTPPVALTQPPVKTGARYRVEHMMEWRALENSARYRMEYTCQMANTVRMPYPVNVLIKTRGFIADRNRLPTNSG